MRDRLLTLGKGAGNEIIRMWERMSVINESRVRSRSKPISWPSCARVSCCFSPGSWLECGGRRCAC